MTTDGREAVRDRGVRQIIIPRFCERSVAIFVPHVTIIMYQKSIKKTFVSVVVFDAALDTKWSTTGKGQKYTILAFTVVVKGVVTPIIKVALPRTMDSTVEASRADGIYSSSSYCLFLCRRHATIAAVLIVS